MIAIWEVVFALVDFGGESPRRKSEADHHEPGTEVNEARQHFVSKDIIRDVMSVCDLNWQTIIALSRFAGLRTPSETLTLRWEHVDFDKGSISICGKGTDGEPRWRVCPIFEDLRPYLIAARDAPGRDDTFVVQGYCGSPDKNIGTQFARWIEKAGHETWPRIWHNNRASLETELLSIYPAKDVTSWLGNSKAVAMKHYAMTQEDSFRAAQGETEEAESEAPEAESEAACGCVRFPGLQGNRENPA